MVAGDGVGWLKLSRLRKLMEVVFVRIIMIIVTIIMSVLIIKYKSFDQDENYRNMILPKLNRSLDCAGSPDDHIQDVVRPCECDATCVQVDWSWLSDFKLMASQLAVPEEISVQGDLAGSSSCHSWTWGSNITLLFLITIINMKWGSFLLIIIIIVSQCTFSSL